MQLFLDCPAIYTTGTITSWWKGGTDGTVVVNNAQLPPSSQSGSQVIWLDVNSEHAGVLSDNFGPSSRMIGACRFYRTGSSGYIMCFVYPNGIGLYPICVGVACDNAGTYICSGNAMTVLGSGPVVPPNEWHHYELDAQMSTSGSATLSLYVDGNPTPFIEVPGVSTAFATASCLSIGSSINQDVNTPGGYYCDGYLLNGASGAGGATFTKALAPQGYGAFKTGYALMNGVGVLSQWTPNGAGTLWQCTNTLPAGTTPYASEATVGQAFFGTIGAIPAIQTLLSAQLATFAWEDDAGPRAIQSGFSNGSTTAYSGTDRYLGGTGNYYFDEYEKNPITTNTWAVADLTTLQIGVKETV